MNDLRDVSLFTDFSPSDIAELAARVVEVRLAPQQALFWEGDAGEHIYFVGAGTLLVSKAVADGVDEVLAHVGPGEVLGEMSVLDGRPRCATVRAETPACLLALHRDDFERVIAEHPRRAALFFRAHARAAVARLRESDDLVTETARWALESTGLDVGDSAAGNGLGR